MKAAAVRFWGWLGDERTNRMLVGLGAIFAIVAIIASAVWNVMTTYMYPPKTPEPPIPSVVPAPVPKQHGAVEKPEKKAPRESHHSPKRRHADNGGHNGRLPVNLRQMSVDVTECTKIANHKASLMEKYAERSVCLASRGYDENDMEYYMRGRHGLDA